MDLYLNKLLIAEWIIDSWKREWNNKRKNEWKLHVSVEEKQLHKLGLILQHLVVSLKQMYVVFEEPPKLKNEKWKFPSMDTSKSLQI